MIKDVYASAVALFDGGWRSTDKEPLIKEYDLTEEEAEQLTEALKVLEQ